MVDRLLGRGREAAGRRASAAVGDGRAIRGTRSGRASSRPATCAGPGRSSSSGRWPTTSSRSTATASSATTRPSSTGFARIDGRRVVVIGQQKGADTDENIRRNFGMPHPEGYRKAMRAMELAERFGMPVVTFVDVPGAHPGAESEERGIAESIARSIGLMSRLRTPIVTVITGEGGSGGALAIAVARRRRRPRERGLLGDQPGGLCVDPLADRRRGADRGRRDADDGRRAAGSRRRRHRRHRARRGRPHRSCRDGPPAQGGHRVAARPAVADADRRARRSALPSLPGIRALHGARRRRPPRRSSDRASRIGCATCSIRVAGRPARAATSRRPETRSDGDRRPIARAVPSRANRRGASRRPCRRSTASPTSCCPPSSPSCRRRASARSRCARGTGRSASADRPATGRHRPGAPPSVPAGPSRVMPATAIRRPASRAIGPHGRDADRSCYSTNGSSPPSLAPVGPGADAATEAAPRAEPRPGQAVATSPAVGVYQPRAEAKPGTRVRAGDRLGAVDMLGVAQEVVAPADGLVGASLVEPGQAVEYGQELVVIELAAGRTRSDA